MTEHKHLDLCTVNKDINISLNGVK